MKEKITLNIEGMSCGHCSAAVTKALKAVKGTSRVSVDLATGTAEFFIKKDISSDTLIQAVEDAGYNAKKLNQ